MKHIITVWCPNFARKVDAHEIPIQIVINYHGEDAEVFGAIPQHCPVCDHAMLEMEQDGMLAEIGDEADKIVEKEFPGMFVRVMPEYALMMQEIR
jgi:hypothetical protein